MEEYDFDGKMDFDGMEEYNFDGKLDFDGMEEYDEENRLEPTGESDGPQDPDNDGNTDDVDNQSSNPEQENESYENLNSESTSTVLISESREEESENLKSDNQNQEEIEEINQEELDKEIEKEFEEGVEDINQYLKEEAEFINAYQEMVGEARELDGVRESEGDEPLKTEEEWEKEIETAAYTAEQIYEGKNEIKANVNNEEISEISEELEIEKEMEQSVEVSEIQLSDLQEEFGEEMNEIEQHQVEALIEEALETESEPIVNEKELEQLQEMKHEEQFQTIQFNEYIEELVEKQEVEKTQEHDKMEQEKDNIKKNQEGMPQSTYLQEGVEEQEQELELEYEENDEIEQHQVEAAIEEELETELKPIINKEELEYVKDFELEKQLDAELLYELIEELAKKQNEEESEGKEEYQESYTEEKVAQITRELKIDQEINPDYDEVEQDGQERELEQQTTFPYKEAEEHVEEEYKDHEQELEEILEQTRKIEQEVFNNIESEEEDSDQTAEKEYEKVKRLYKQQTGRRPIYANQETKGFKQWLEQREESEEKEKTKHKEELKEEQKEEEWKVTLKNWIELVNEIEPEVKSELKKLIEEYNELEKLIKRYSQLYNNALCKELSQTEKIELNSLIIALQKLGSIKIELFLGIRESKRYIDDHYYFNFWNKQHHYQVFSHIFTHLSQKYSSLKQLQKKKIYTEKILKNWIEEVSEEKINPKLKVMLKEIVENFSELEELTIRFMDLYRKVQNKQISEAEKSELKLLINTLKKLEPTKIELFTSIRAIKHYLNDQIFDNFSDKMHVNRILNHFFTYRVHSPGQLFNDGNLKYLHDKDGNKIPYLDIGKDVLQLTPLEFKRTYKGVYSPYFKHVKNTHNLHLGVKTVGKLLNLFKFMNVYGIVYKISLIRDVQGNKFKTGPFIFYSDNKKVKEGLIRIGRTIDLRRRVITYRYEANNNIKNLHFENAFLKYGPRAFKIELLTVCKSSIEYKASEYFWTLFYNKKADQIGFNLSINKDFNPMIGSRGDKFKKYNVPKWKLTSNILGGFERAELDILWENVPLGTLKSRIKSYFNTSNLYKIRLDLATPYIDKCLRRGYTKDEALDYLLQNGFYMFSDKEFQARIKSFSSKIKRSSPDRLFQRMIKDLQIRYYHIPLRKVTGRSTSYYEQLRFNLFIIPYHNYLKSIDVQEKLQNPSINYDHELHRFRALNLEDIKDSLNEFSIIEHLVKLNATNIQIAYALNFCNPDDDVRVRENARGKIDTYFERYKRRIARISGVQIKDISTNDVRNFIKSYNFGISEYQKYLKNEEL